VTFEFNNLILGPIHCSLKKLSSSAIGGGRGQWLGGHYGECGARAYNGGPGAEPLVRGTKPPEALVRGTKPPEAESIFVIGCPTEPANLAPVRENRMLCYSPLVSELGGQSAWCPNPVIGGPVPPGSAAYVFSL